MNPELDGVLDVLQAGREVILDDWIERVRDNPALEAHRRLPEKELRDHFPQVFDAILDRLVVGRSRDEAEQFATIHGFARRAGGYDPLQVAIEFFMFRRAFWEFLCNECSNAAPVLAAMDLIDGLLDRAVIASLRALGDPEAGQLRRTDDAPEA